MKTKIYFLPGTMCDSNLWLELWTELTELDNRYELIHLTIPVENSIDEIVQVLADQLPKEKINLLGFSQGGYLASAFACQYPERINTLINLSNAPDKLPDEEIATREKIILWIKAQGYSGITLTRIKTFLHVNNHSTAHIIDRIKQMDSHFGENGLLHQLKSTTIRKNLLPQLATASFPMLFCYGDSDLLVNAATVEKLSSANPFIKQYQFLNTGHMLPLEQPSQLALTLVKFMTNHL